MTERDAFGNPIDPRHAGATGPPPPTPPTPPPASAGPTPGTAGATPGQSDALVALIAAVSGYLFFPVLGWIVGVIFARRARAAIDAAGHGPRGMAQAALVLSWIGLGLVLAFIAVTALVVIVGATA